MYGYNTEPVTIIHSHQDQLLPAEVVGWAQEVFLEGVAQWEVPCPVAQAGKLGQQAGHSRQHEAWVPSAS